MHKVKIHIPSQLQGQFDHERWDISRSIEEFQNAIRNQEGRHAEAVMKALDRLGCWNQAVAHVIAAPSPDPPLGEGLRWLWTTYGFHVGESMRGGLALLDAMKRFVPPYFGAGRRLYRGELESRYLKREYGIAWTPNIEVARTFSARRNSLGEGAGILLELDATTSMIVVGPNDHSKHIGEHEYLLNPRLIETCRS